MKKYILIGLAAAGLIFLPAKASATERIVLSRYTVNSMLSFTCDESLWKSINNNCSFSITDEGTPDVKGYASVCLRLPAAVVATRRHGIDVKILLEKENPFSCALNFGYTYSYINPAEVEVRYMIMPGLSGYYLNDYVNGLNCRIPLIDKSYGYNQYFLYPLLGKPKRVQGFFSKDNPLETFENLMHPSYILDSTGRLKDKLTLDMEGELKSTFFYRAGNGNLKNADGINLIFYAPVKLTFYYEYDDSNDPSSKDRYYPDIDIDDEIFDEPEPDIVYKKLRIKRAF